MIDTVALREKVLDLAIRGKLVPQDPNDEPASVLLERIRAQKQQMVKDGKLKAKDIKDDSIIFVGEDNLHYEKFADGTEKCIEDEIPFELPPSWSWCRLGVLFAHNTGKALNSSDTTGTRLTYITTSNLYWDRFELDSLKEMPFTESEIEKCTVRKGDLLVCEGGDIGRSAIWLFDDEIRIQNHIHRLRSYIELSNRFYYYVMYLWKRMERIGGQGIGLQGFSSKALHKLIVPLPPVNEQFSVVEKLDSILGSVDALDELNAEFTVDVECIKKQILDLAIRGKLVPQNPDDEPAAELLNRIRAEKEELIKRGKIKRDKKESVIFKSEDNSYYEKFDDGEIKCIDEDVPFELPESWCWCRLGTLFAHNTGKALNSSDSAGTLMTYITTSNLYWDRFELDSLKEMPFTDSEIEKCTVTKGDLLVCEGGDIGRSAIWMHNEDIRIQNHIHRLRPYISLSNRFYYYVLFMWKQTGRIGGQGIGLQGFSSKALHNLIVPLPPLSEQQHIVAYVDELNQKLSDIEKSLS